MDLKNIPCYSQVKYDNMSSYVIYMRLLLGIPGDKILVYYIYMDVQKHI